MGQENYNVVTLSPQQTRHRPLEEEREEVPRHRHLRLSGCKHRQEHFNEAGQLLTTNSGAETTVHRVLVYDQPHRDWSNWAGDVSCVKNVERPFGLLVTRVLQTNLLSCDAHN